MTSPAPDWGAALEAAALEILGEPSARYTHALRYGTRGSLVVNIGGPRAGRWRSWEQDTGGGVVDFIQWKLGLMEDEARQWLRDRRLIDSGISAQTVSVPSTHSTHSRVQSSGTKGQPHDSNRHSNHARSLWAVSEPISSASDHPARRWMKNRNLWRPELPLIGAVRYVPATHPLFRGLHQGAGSIAVLMAPPAAWEEAWPGLPDLAGIHLVSIDADGMPALDRPEDYTDRQGIVRPGLGKRFYGGVAGTVAIFGNPNLAETHGPARVVEGLADGLALASRFEGPVIAAIGTPARLAKDPEFVAWLAGSPHGVVIHADADGPGQSAAGALRRALWDAGAKARAVVPPADSGKDAADVARNLPFPPLLGSWKDCAAALQRSRPVCPRWEVERQAAIAVGGG